MRRIWRYLVETEEALWAEIRAFGHGFLLFRMFYDMMFRDPSEWEIHSMTTLSRGFRIGDRFIGYRTDKIVCSCGRVFLDRTPRIDPDME